MSFYRVIHFDLHHSKPSLGASQRESECVEACVILIREFGKNCCNMAEENSGEL